MSQVVEEGDGTYRVRRQRRSMIVLAIVLLSLAGAFYYASSYFRTTTPTPGPCTTVPPTATGLRPNDVSLNVYNATNRKGLAAATAKVARERGFQVKAVANDPKDATVKQVAQIRFGPEGAASAKVVQVRVPKAVLVNDKRKDDTVDLVLGAAWKGFAPEPAVATPTQTLRQCPTITVTQ